jgi:hypothetical protein
MDCKTYEMLSLLSRALSRLPDISGSSPKDAAKTLLHKCVSQFTCQQQIHAQQAVRYVRGFGDGISSHKTVPMMSSLLLSSLRSVVSQSNFIESETLGPMDENREEDSESLPTKIALDNEGNLLDTHQFHHYYHRAETFSHMSFYDFCRYVRIENRNRRSHVKNTPETRLGVFERHELKPSHPLHKTHHLIEHTNEDRGDGQYKLVPRVVGMSIPRESSASWPLFALAHFKPFGVSQPLISAGDTCENVFTTYPFSAFSLKVIKNWHAIHECEDERDGERLRKRAAETKESIALTTSIAFQDLMEYELDVALFQKSTSERDFKVQQVVLAMHESNWLKPLATPSAGITSISSESHGSQLEAHMTDINLPDLTPSLLKSWKTSIKTQEQVISDRRRNALNLEQQSTSQAPSSVPETTGNNSLFSRPSTNTNNFPTFPSPLTVQPSITLARCEQHSPEEIVTLVENEFQLNRKQTHAFRIIAKHFLRRFILKDLSEAPLRMLLTGPGGTGKTHVVKALRKVMTFYGCEHKIRFLAPTGSAASLVDGMTVHKGLGIKILKSDGRGKGNRSMGESNEDYTVLVSIKNKTQLRDEWRNVDILLIDEASLLSAQLLCEIDHALRYAKERPDAWFGDVTIIFAGDFFQYPPVVGTALYMPVSMYAGQTNEEIQWRLGRMAWKSVESHDERRVILFVSHEQQTTHSAFFYFPCILWQSIASAAISFPHMKLLHYTFCLVSLMSPAGPSHTFYSFRFLHLFSSCPIS